ncbi:hypothetical protein ACRB68_65090 [Actinomadura sp. RB68]|uniref:Uncharacterized protein n=2 Tax=Actinomadura macrotermitis TaxID=2585200 RepID=A0A7K0C5L1_9ACTN|nr:hypothetical protein [Actinomadura macrotermitis]
MEARGGTVVAHVGPGAARAEVYGGVARELWGRRRRIAGLAGAVMLAVAFLAGTLALGDAEVVDGTVPSGLRSVLAGFGGVALLVAAFGVHRACTGTAAQRARETARLRARGVAAGRIRALAAAEALAAGAAGTVLGLAAAAWCVRLLSALFPAAGLHGLAAGATPGPAVAAAGLLVPLHAVLRRTGSGGPSESRVIIGGAVAAVAAGAVVSGAFGGRADLAMAGAIMMLGVVVVLGPVVAGGRAATAPAVGFGAVALLAVLAGSLRADLRDVVYAMLLLAGTIVLPGCLALAAREPGPRTWPATPAGAAAGLLLGLLLGWGVAGALGGPSATP